MGTSVTRNEHDVHHRMIKAALEEFACAGYKGASTKAITERAGVNEVTLFRHFGSKLGLLRAAARYALSEMQIPKPAEEYIHLPFREGFYRFLETHSAFIAKQHDIFTLGMVESFSHPEVADLLKGFMWEIRSALVAYFEKLHEQGRMRAGDYPVLAHSILSTLYTTPLIRQRAPLQVSVHLTDERIIESLVETVVSAYSLEKEIEKEDT